jgi:pimeloyl-ACP methyl ester carboxylesterase
VPVLVLTPEFTPAILADRRTPYLRSFFTDSWESARSRGNVRIRPVPNAAVNIWLDQPEPFSRALQEFIRSIR